MKRLLVLLLALSAVPAMAVPPNDAPDLRLVYSSGTAGEIEPCG